MGYEVGRYAIEFAIPVIASYKRLVRIEHGHAQRQISQCRFKLDGTLLRQFCIILQTFFEALLADDQSKNVGNRLQELSFIFFVNVAVREIENEHPNHIAVLDKRHVVMAMRLNAVVPDFVTAIEATGAN